jgi:SAM-dependent methyltransferase
VRHVLHTCRRQFDRNFKPQRALDFGCGVGRLLVGFAEQVTTVVGVDVSEAMLAEARLNCDRHGHAQVELLLSDDQLSRVEGQFDLIHSVIVFQHIEPVRGRQIAGRLIDLLAPGGIAALHFTYAKAWFADSCGQAPAAPPASPPAPLSAPRRWLSPLRAALRPRPAYNGSDTTADADPVMEMHSYPMNELMYLIQACGARTTHLEFTDHGGELGTVMYFRRPPA